MASPESRKPPPYSKIQPKDIFWSMARWKKKPLFIIKGGRCKYLLKSEIYNYWPHFSWRRNECLTHEMIDGCLREVCLIKERGKTTLVSFWCSPALRNKMGSSTFRNRPASELILPGHPVSHYTRGSFCHFTVSRKRKHEITFCVWHCEGCLLPARLPLPRILHWNSLRLALRNASTPQILVTLFDICDSRNISKQNPSGYTA